MRIALPGVNCRNFKRTARSRAQTFDVLDDESGGIRLAISIEKASVGSATPDREARNDFVILRITIGEH